MKTLPIKYIVPTDMCRCVFVRFTRPHIQSMFHRLGDCVGSSAIIVDFNETSSMHLLHYISDSGVVLKTIAYSAAEVIEITQEESVCTVQFGEAS